MRGLYIAFQPLVSSSGITNKIISQRNGLSNNGILSDLCYQKDIQGKIFYYINDNPLFCIGSHSIAHLSLYFRYGPIYKYITKNSISFVYIRYFQFATPFFLFFLRRLKRQGITVFMEIPTYPYDSEAKGGVFKKVLQAIEQRCRKKFSKYVKRIVTVQNYNYILGIKTIKISNGIDVNQIKLRDPQKHSGTNIIAVAHMCNWHAYDRIIEGLGLFYKYRQPHVAHLYLIGSASDNIRNMYLDIINKYNIGSYVHMVGVKDGAALDYYFDIADIAIGCLGCHRKGVSDAKPLKCVEYATRGIPFIYSENNSDFDTAPFVKKVPADETPINVESIIEFYKNNSFEPEIIRNYVEERLTWDSQMKKVSDELDKMLD